MASPEDRAIRPLTRLDQPLWRQLQDDVIRRVEQGGFATGFPGEHALRQEYGVSRDTVRRALRALREHGLVTANRGQMSRVASAEIEQPLGALYSLFASVEAAGFTQRSVVRVLDVRADGVVAVRLGLEESTPLLHLERLRLADDEPLAIDRVWLPANRTRPLLDADFTHTGLYDQLSVSCGLRLTGGQEQIHAVVTTKAEASHLGCAEQGAAFAIYRIGCLDGQPVEWRHTLIRADRFRLSADFSATGGYRLHVGDTHNPTTRESTPTRRYTP